jgi:hypothetical protein
MGDSVKNLETGEVGTVVEIIMSLGIHFGYIVETNKGIKRWIIKKESFSKKG